MTTGPGAAGKANRLQEQFHAVQAASETLGTTTMTCVAAEDSVGHGLVYLAPYLGGCIADGLRAAGEKCLLVYDDVTGAA